MDAESLIRLAATDEDHDEMRQSLEHVLELSFVARGPDGVYIPNGQDAHVAAADWLRENTDREDSDWLRENTDREDFVIANTLSRLPAEWPDTDTAPE